MDLCAMADGHGRCSSLFFSSVCMVLGWKHSSRKNQIKLSAGEAFLFAGIQIWEDEIFRMDFSLNPLKLDGSTTTEG